MDTVAVNGATVARMVDFLTRELDAAQKKLEELKQEKESAQTRIEELNLVNEKLREKVGELESGRVKVPVPVKQETQNDEKPLLASREAQDQSSRDAEKDARIAELEKSVDEYRGKLQRMACAVGNQTRHDPETSSRSDDNDDDDDESGDDTQSEDGDEEEEEDDESGSDEEEEEGSKEGTIRGLPENESAVRDLGSAHTRNAFNKILGNFPQAKGRPSFNKLRPVCASKTNLEEYLASDPRTSWKDHALVFGPIFAFKSQAWSETFFFSHLLGKTIELFFPHKNRIYYGGSYICHNSRPQNKDGFPIQEDTSPRSLAEASIEKCAKNRDAMCKVVTRMYLDGVLKAECLGLQCVGFNHGLNSVLSQRLADQKTTRKRKADAGQSNPRKRKKTKK